jgi:hypothetical protein
MELIMGGLRDLFGVKSSPTNFEEQAILGSEDYG